jgi:solute carrier family 25 iron transporter 28/37
MAGAPEDAPDLVVRFEEWEEWDSTMPFWRHAVAGSCAGIVEHVGMYPLDTVKTHMQALRPGGRLSFTDVLREISRESPLGFMRGASAIASGCIPAHVALFTSYEYSKKRLLTQGGEHEPARAAACGAASTFCHDLILTPMDVVKQRMQLGAYRSIGDCLRQIWYYEGVGALYRSMPTTLAMNVPFGSVLVAVNESLKLHLGLDQPDRQKSGSTLPWYFFSAGCSGAIASAATQPLDVIKTRLQTQDCHCYSSAAPASAAADARSAVSRGTAGQVMAENPASAQREFGVIRPKYTGFRSALLTIVQEEGAWALYHGLLPRMLHAIPAAAMCWGTYETVKNMLGC